MIKKKYIFVKPEKVSFENMVEESLKDFKEIDASIAQRTINVYAYDCFDYAGNGNYFAYPDCMTGESF